MRMFILAATAAVLVPLAAAAAQQPADPKISQVIVYGDDACPASTDDTIVVCARKPEGERYRIPENLRDEGSPRSESWANRAVELQYVGRSGIGSCSTAGPGGMIGCFEQLVRQARAERGLRDEVNWNALIEEARRERLSRIDEEAEAAEGVVRERESREPE